MRTSSLLILTQLSLLSACGDSERDVSPTATTEEPTGVVMTDWDARLAQDELERARLDPSWQRVVQIDSLGPDARAGVNPQSFDEITPEAVNTGPMPLPMQGGEGPSVLRAQILLDRAFFSPGIIDGHWGKNTEKALYWFQSREGLPRTGQLDERTFERLVDLAGAPGELVRRHILSAEDVEGPFTSLPDDIYERAELDCLCYESLAEKLAELFHTSPRVLEQLNPEIPLNDLVAGDPLHVAAIREPDSGRGAPIDRLVVSAEGFYVHAVDANDRIVYHFPSTLGSSFDPSPTGEHRVTSITPDPWWHYQPEILEHIDSEEADAMIPPGPNNAVGVVWMALSIPHYGIHGTAAPETIGYTTSAGCVRLTNWDALFLSERIDPGTDVDFTGG